MKYVKLFAKAKAQQAGDAAKVKEIVFNTQKN